MVKPIESFPIITSKKQYRRRLCKSCYIDYYRPRWAAYNRKAKFGMTDEDYKSILEKQNGCCAICKEGSKLVVDHCHKTGKIRALLCDSCNKGLGFFDDNPHLIKKAIEYIDTFNRRYRDQQP